MHAYLNWYIFCWMLHIGWNFNILQLFFWVYIYEIRFKSIWKMLFPTFKSKPEMTIIDTTRVIQLDGNVVRCTCQLPCNHIVIVVRTSVCVRCLLIGNNNLLVCVANAWSAIAQIKMQEINFNLRFTALCLYRTSTTGFVCSDLLGIILVFQI